MYKNFIPNYLRILTYNVEWGFLNLPKDIIHDAGNHKIPNNIGAQKEHLKLIAKNIGLSSPHICFMQEMGSINSVQYVADLLKKYYGLIYRIHYSGVGTGYQGIGTLVHESIVYYSSSVIESFGMHRAFQITTNGITFIGLHAKSLGYGDHNENIKKQDAEMNAIISYINQILDKNPEQSFVICGDFNNTRDSQPLGIINNFQIKTLNGKRIEKMIDLVNSNCYLENITGNRNTEFSRSSSGLERSSRIDYIWCNEMLASKCLSCQIINFEREYIGSHPNLNIRQENSDHLPVLAIFNI